jgi:hypothetical protein
MFLRLMAWFAIKAPRHKGALEFFMITWTNMSHEILQHNDRFINLIPTKGFTWDGVDRTKPHLTTFDEYGLKTRLVIPIEFFCTANISSLGSKHKINLTKE